MVDGRRPVPGDHAAAELLMRSEHTAAVPNAHGQISTGQGKSGNASGLKFVRIGRVGGIDVKRLPQSQIARMGSGGQKKHFAIVYDRIERQIADCDFVRRPGQQLPSFEGLNYQMTVHLAAEVGLSRFAATIGLYSAGKGRGVASASDGHLTTLKLGQISSVAYEAVPVLQARHANSATSVEAAVCALPTLRKAN